MTGPAPVLLNLSGKRVFVAGHSGMAGSAIMRRLVGEDCEIVTVGRAGLDLTMQAPTEHWLSRMRPHAVFLAAGRVGGIQANQDHAGDFIADNLAIALNVMRACLNAHVGKLLFLGSACVYPRLAPQPIEETALLTGPLEPTNEPYAVAKIAGITLAQSLRRQHGADFISLMPANLYGPGDNYHPEHSHVPAALIRRFHEAKVTGTRRVTVWGTGSPMREFLAADDLGDACVFAMKHYSAEAPLNVGSGEETSIAGLAALIAEIVGYTGEIAFDPGRPDGMPRRILDGSRLGALGWQARTPLRAGLAAAYADFLKHEGRWRER